MEKFTLENTTIKTCERITTISNGSDSQVVIFNNLNIIENDLSQDLLNAIYRHLGIEPKDKHYMNCINDAYKLVTKDFFPELDNLVFKTVLDVVEKVKDEMFILEESIMFEEISLKQVPKTLADNYKKFLDKWEKFCK